MTRRPQDNASPAPARNAGERLVRLGRIKGAHGIRGEVIVTSYTEAPADIGAYGPLTARQAGKPDRTVTVRSARETSKGIVARLEGLSDRNAAEALKGADLFVARSALPEADEGEFYHEDLIGLTAVDADGKPFGRVRDVANYGAGDLLEIDLDPAANEGRRGSELVPFTHAHVPDVRLSDGVVVVNWPLAFVIAQPDEPDEPDASGGDPAG